MPAVLTTAPVQWFPTYAYNAGTGELSIGLTDLPGLTADEAAADIRKLLLTLLQQTRRKYSGATDAAATYRFDTGKMTLSESVAPVHGVVRLQHTITTKFALSVGTEEVIAP